MNADTCDRCSRPVFPFASDAMRRSGQVCTCVARVWPSHAPLVQNAATGPCAPKTTEKKAVSDLEGLYLSILAEYAPDLPVPLRQQQVIPDRGFTVDFLFPKERVVVEIDGMAHRVKSRFLNDAEKHNLLVLGGWVYLRFTGTMLRKQVMTVVEQTKKALETNNVRRTLP